MGAANFGGDGSLPHLGDLGEQDLRELIAQLSDREHSVSYERRMLHGRIDLLRAELVNRRSDRR